MKHICLVFPFLFVMFGISQEITVTGNIFDLKTDEPLFAVKVVTMPVNDTLSKKGGDTDENGYFKIQNLQKGKHTFRLDYFGYETTEFTLVIDSSIDLGKIKISEDSQLMDEVTVSAQQMRVIQRGDTTAYNADAYKTNRDASVEELITKMPGITVENGKVKAQGEDVRKVLIDGEEFFGEDAITAVRNLPAEIVQQIEVFDRQSEQARFTGFDDGEEYKTLNIVTKSGKNSGQFGKIYAGYGTENRYTAGGSVNFFKGSRKISVIGLSNNINQQNFSNEDILGILGDNGGGRGGRRGGGGATDNFMIGQQRGITTTHSIGINYADKWGKDTKVSGSYFFNQGNNENNSQTNRQYIIANQEGQRYIEDQWANSTNNNHRFNFRLEHDIDSNNSLVFTPRISLQQNVSNRTTDAGTSLTSGQMLNTLLNDNQNDNLGINLNGNLLYRHKFKKEGRTISTNFTGGYNQRSGQQFQYSLSEFFGDNVDSISLVDQVGDNLSDGYNFGTDISFTEKIGKKSMLQFNYAPSYSRSNADKTTYEFDPLTGMYSEVDTLLSSVFNNINITQRTGISYRFGGEKLNFQLRMNYQNRIIMNDQTLPTDRDVRLEFNNLLPMASVRYKLSKTKNLRLFYSTNTHTPSVTQLQDVVDNSNPLRLRSGNAALEQEFDHRLVLRYISTNTEKASSFYVFVRGEYKSDYITNATTIAQSDTLLQGNVLLREGAQYTRPENLDGAWNVRAQSSYGRPINKLKSNLNLNLGAGYLVTPGMINEIRNESNTLNLNSGITISSNISEKIDFRVGYTYNYNVVNNSVIPQAFNTYQIHTPSGSVTWLPWKKLVLSSSIYANSYLGLEEEFNQTVLLWNAGIGFKFLKNELAEIRLSGFDLLNNNNSIIRNVTDYYIEDLQTQVLNRYFMLTLTYNLRNFGKGK